MSPSSTPHSNLDGRATYSDGGRRSLPPSIRATSCAAAGRQRRTQGDMADDDGRDRTGDWGDDSIALSASVEDMVWFAQ